MEEQEEKKSGDDGSPKKVEDPAATGNGTPPVANDTPSASGTSPADNNSPPVANDTPSASGTPSGGNNIPPANNAPPGGNNIPPAANDFSSTESTSPLRRHCKTIKSYINSRPALRAALIVTALLFGVLVILSIPLYLAPAIQNSWGTSRAECAVDSSLLTNRTITRQIANTKNEITRLERRLASFIPTQTYLVINTVDNRFSLYRSRKLIREGFCSSGSYTLLKTEDGEQEWIFKTPRGRFTILGKITHPVWRKPDWAFVEEGLPIPGPTDASRYEYGVLGDYAMSLGDGYLIHGTLYKRLLGMPVTHGCIRLNDDDLEAVFNALSVGSKVYIY